MGSLEDCQALCNFSSVSKAGGGRFVVGKGTAEEKIGEYRAQFCMATEEVVHTVTALQGTATECLDWKQRV